MKTRISLLVLLVLLLFVATQTILNFFQQTLAVPTTSINPTYGVADIRKMCQLLGGVDRHQFCDLYSAQDGKTLNVLLGEKFPAGKATYADVMRYFGKFPSQWWSDCPQNTHYKSNGVLDYCPLPQSCQGTWYVCTFSFSDAISGVYVRFDNLKGTVLEIRAPTRSDS